jgi:hypothetical protein
MANEPERPIERLLRATAKKRRDEAGAPLELHPATRRLLQGEAARKYPAAQRTRRSFFQGLGQLWPRFAWGVGMLAVLGVTVWLLVPMPGKNEPHALLAHKQPTPLPGSPQEDLPLPAIAPAAAPAAPAPAAEANPQVVAFADTAPPAVRKPAPEVAVQPQPLPKDTFAAAPGGVASDKLALAAAPQLANREKSAEAEVAASSRMLAPAPATTVNGASASRFGLVGQPASRAAAPAVPASPSSVTTASGLAAVVATDESAKLAIDRADQPGFAYKSLPSVASANAPEPVAAAADGRLDSAVALRKEARSISTTQWFAQMPQSTKTKRSLDDKAAPAQPVLASFQVEQAGRELRIVDGDGSVYRGYLQLADAAHRRASATAEAPAAARASRALGAVLEEKSKASLDADQPVPQTYFFRVTGTNRSLQKKVVFTGNLLSATNLTLFQSATNDLRGGGSLVGYRGAAAQPALLPLLNSRISGKVVIGSGQPIEINALPAAP